MLVDLEKHGIDFEERRDGVVGVGDGVAGIDRVAEGAGIAEVMAAGHRRAVRHGEGRKQRVRVLEIDALVAQLGHRRRGLRRHDAPAQAVRHEQDQVTRVGVLRRRRACGKCDQSGGQQQDCAAHQVLPHRKAVPAIRRRFPFSFALRQDCYIVWNRPQGRATGYKPPRPVKGLDRSEETSEPRRRSPLPGGQP